MGLGLTSPDDVAILIPFIIQENGRLCVIVSIPKGIKVVSLAQGEGYVVPTL